MKTLILTVLFVCALFGQDAKVIQLKSEDAATSKRLYEAVEAAKKAYAEFRESVESKYLNTTDRQRGSMIVGGGSDNLVLMTGCNITDGKDYKCSDFTKLRELYGDKYPIHWDGSAWVVDFAHPIPPTVYRLKGWDYGFNFTDDFKFIVPDAAKPFTSSWPTVCGAYTGITNTVARDITGTVYSSPAFTDLSRQ